jgi:hypothetical protein
MKKIIYLATAFTMTLSFAVISCNKSDDVDASMLSPGPAVNSQTVAAAPANNTPIIISGDSLQNSSACKCPHPNVGTVDTTGKD